MHNVENLVGELTRIDVAAVGMVGNEGDVQGADVGDVRKTLEEMVLLFVSWVPSRRDGTQHTQSL